MAWIGLTGGTKGMDLMGEMKELGLMGEMVVGRVGTRATLVGAWHQRRRRHSGRCAILLKFH